MLTQEHRGRDYRTVQPGVRGLIERIATELSARAVVLLHENGQVLEKNGWIDDSEFPTMAALVAAMIATGKSLQQLGDKVSAEGAANYSMGAPSRFACDSEAMGLYTVGVAHDVWLAVLYDQPLNPGQLRMKIRRYAELLAKLGLDQPEPEEAFEQAALPAPGRDLSSAKSSLFGEISDDEIDRLFDEARS